MNLTLIAVSSRTKKIFKQEAVKGRKGLFEKYAGSHNAVGAASAAVPSPGRGGRQ